MSFAWEPITEDDLRLIRSLGLKNILGAPAPSVASHWAVDRVAGQALLSLGGGMRGEIPLFWAFIDGDEVVDLVSNLDRVLGRLPDGTVRLGVEFRYVGVPRSVLDRRGPIGLWAALNDAFTVHENGPRVRGRAVIELLTRPDITVKER